MSTILSRPGRRTTRFGVLASVLLLAGTALAQFPVADWTLETVDGGVVSLHDELAQGPVVVNFWATWCKPCLKELPHLNRIAGEYAGQVSFLAVNTDNTRAVAKVAPFVSATGYTNLTFPMDTGAEVQQLMQMSGILPFLVVYDSAGREVYRHVGFKEGDEVELEHVLADLMAAETGGERIETGKPDWAEAVSATNRLEYSYSTKTKKEIFDNWLDVAYQFGGFRTGIMLKSSAPAEEGDRGNEIEHRFFEFQSGGATIRAGHFYGIYGRGLVFNAYEDRAVRVDTRLDGLTASWRGKAGSAAVFSGTPSVKDLDLRSADLEGNLPAGLRIGTSGMTWETRDGWTGEDGTVHRDWVYSLRARQQLDFLDWYFEYGERNGFDPVFQPGSLEYNEYRGTARYANVNLYHGPFSVSWEHSDYNRFRIIENADGTADLNRPPSLTRDFTWTMMNRSPHPTNADNETGNNLDILFNSNWKAVLSGVRLYEQPNSTSEALYGDSWHGELLYELAWASLQTPRFGDLKVTGGFGYQDQEGLRQTAVAEVVWFLNPSHSLTLQAEHQHVRPDFDPNLDEGAYDEDWFSLEFAMAPTWSFTGFLEVNNKYDEQRAPDEDKGPFPAGQVSYTIARGGNLNLWFGKRQAGFICSGGVCKYEPEFEGVEFFGVFRY